MPSTAATGAIVSETRLSLFQSELAETLKGVAALNFVSDAATETIPTLPAALVYGQRGRVTHAPLSVLTFHTDIAVVILASKNSMYHAWQVAGPLLEDIPDAIYDRLGDSGFTAISNIGGMEWELTEFEVGGVAYFGLVMTLLELKYQRTV